MRKITSHVAFDNAASRRTMEKAGFTLGWSGLREDWGLDAPVVVNKYICKLTHAQKQAFCGACAAELDSFEKKGCS